MTLDLAAYFARIGYAGGREATLETLQALHFAHPTHIPFENLDIQLGLPVKLDLDSLQDKLIVRKRGGYCFEQNAVFAAALDALGFQVTRLAGRVSTGSTRINPRTHMLLRVDLDGGPWLADVGFGAETLLAPVPLEGDEVSEQFGWRYRVIKEDAVYLLQLLQGEAWRELYRFTLDEQYPIDYEMANHYTSTHPNSGFVRSVSAGLPGPEIRLSLRNRELTEMRGQERITRRIEGDEALLELLAERFGLVLPTGSRFRALQELLLH